MFSLAVNARLCAVVGEGCVLGDPPVVKQVMRRSIGPLLLCGLALLGCEATVPTLSPRGDVGLASGPSVEETYVIDGVVRANTVAGSFLRGAVVRAWRDGEPFAAAARSGTDGRFQLQGRANEPSDLAQTVNRLNVTEPEPSGAGAVVLHNFSGVQHHEHYEVRIHVELDGYATATTAVNVPRRLDADPIEIWLKAGGPFRDMSFE